MDKRLTNASLSTLLQTLADFLMPRVCVVCGRQLLAGEEHLCSCCLAGLPLTHFEGMPHNPMADMYNALVEAPAYERAAALFYYKGEYGRITQALKYGRNFGAGRWFARMLGERLQASGAWSDVDLVCCVPLHWTRRFSRGYNQAEVIAREVASVLGVPFERRLLRRVRRTGSQTRLDAGSRLANVADAFAVRKRYFCSPSGASWRRSFFMAGTSAANQPLTQSDGAGHPTIIGPAPQRVLLIDDVLTTGATLAACSAALRAAFGPSVRISVATLGFAEA
jgi:predicted amidophosphoribosyltransferase